MYQVHGVGDNRILVVPENTAYKFKQNNQLVKFKRSGSNLIAAVSSVVMVYKKPQAVQYHYEYMRNNSRRLAGWGAVDDDTLLNNMLEFVESI